MESLSEKRLPTAHLSALIISLLTLFSLSSQAQYHLSTELDYVFGFNARDISLHHAHVDANSSHGYQFLVINSYRIKESSFEPLIKIGFKYLHTSGEMTHLKYDSDTYKLVIGIGSRYYVSPKISVGVLLGIENNLDFDYFRTQTSDLFRYSTQAEFQYQLTKHWASTFTYDYTFYPTRDHYLFTNPQHQMRVGIIYKIL
ncbi:outer membrane beta-barrel protein [bacterium SCSIO 12643]|nr:outer membrane beta-barrel protein [bacterium SCSIO 12643]